ncbi:hypothetical protein ACP4OV_008319 [Aristida adscensionis]
MAMPVEKSLDLELRLGLPHVVSPHVVESGSDDTAGIGPYMVRPTAPTNTAEIEEPIMVEVAIPPIDRSNTKLRSISMAVPAPMLRRWSSL